jgi:carbon monoxide dehydrogenase subunit G
MPTFRHTIDISATPEQVWEVLGDLTSVDRWVPGVTAVTRTATGRVCTFADGRTLDEQILDYSPQDRSYRYVIDGAAPVPVRENVGRFTVEATDGHARVVWESSLEPVDPAAAGELAKAWEPFLPIVLTNLKNAVEGR